MTDSVDISDAKACDSYDDEYGQYSAHLCLP
jgi:hypothetical protein